MNARIICLRHAEAEPFSLLAAGDTSARKSPSDPPLTPTGQSQAEAAAVLLRDENAQRIFVSDARRSRQTGEIIASRLGLEVESVPALAETLMEAVGTETSEMGSAGEVLRQWLVRGDLSCRLDDGETGQQVAQRMKQALLDIASRCQERSAIVVGHVASLTVGVSVLCHNGSSLWGKPLAHATPFSLTLSDGVWQVDWPQVTEVG